MKKVMILNGVIVVLLVTLLVIINYGSYEMSISQITKKPSRVIILDAGHGGVDGGAVGNSGTVEKYINLLITQKLKGYLDLFGYTTLMLREGDEGLYEDKGRIRDKKLQDLDNRKSLIKNYDGDIFISIHLNKFSEEKYYGAQVFYEKGDEASHKLATRLQQQLIKDLNNGNNRIEKASSGYFLLKGNEMPSAIIECGFLSNSNEEALLKNEAYQNKIAFAIFKGINDYYNSIN
jgi:N-acetylmuramoyl-L-alanine amidase